MRYHGAGFRIHAVKTAYGLGLGDMSEKASHLESLARLTRENSDTGRQQLLHEVTDLFMEAPESLSQREIAYFDEIMGRIVTDVETMVRQHLSETIAKVANAPPDLITSLANDRIEVALPVLVGSEVLEDDDLVKIVENRGQEHMKAISTRSSVAEKVTDALVVKGNDTVLETLAGNDGARFSRGGMKTIVERAKDNESLNRTLVSRQDMPEDLTKEMFWRVSWAMREQILDADGDLDEVQVEALMKETEQWFAAQEAARELNPADGFITRKEKLNQLDNGLLLKLIRHQEMPEFVAGLGRLARIDLETAHQTVFDPTGEKLAIVCKALDMNHDVFAEILMLTDFEGARSLADTDALLDVYNKITREVAQRALRFLRTRKVMQKKLAAEKS